MRALSRTLAAVIHNQQVSATQPYQVVGKRSRRSIHGIVSHIAGYRSAKLRISEVLEKAILY